MFFFLFSSLHFSLNISLRSPPLTARFFCSLMMPSSIMVRLSLRIALSTSPSLPTLIPTPVVFILTPPRHDVKPPIPPITPPPPPPIVVVAPDAAKGVS